MKKGYLSAIIIIVLVISVSIFYYWSITQIFKPVVSVSMGKINIDEQNEIEILYIPGNATSQNITQIRKINNTTKEKYVLGNYERYNYLDKYYLSEENLIIILRDTSIHHFESIDTVQLNIQNIKYKIK
ncbi:MAG: hypothetical protein LBP83_02800 [Dysgonamonadaceae bacterium]|jgi:hypothetical protein|nr:hypothetical protein [Dysgonamonadaceae bacterium]